MERIPAFYVSTDALVFSGAPAPYGIQRKPARSTCAGGSCGARSTNGIGMVNSQVAFCFAFTVGLRRKVSNERRQVRCRINASGTSEIKEAPAIVRINDAWCDVSAWAEKHPGGAWFLQCCHGRDVTALFHLIHWRPDSNSKATLEKLPKVDPELMRETCAQPFAFQAKIDAPKPLVPKGHSKSAFARELAELFAQEFPTLESTKADAFHWTLIVLAMISTCICWTGWLQGNMLAATTLPFVHWLLTGLTFHEAGHGGLSSNPSVNWAMQFTALPITYNPWVFWASHQFSHHPYTNNEHYDSDVHLWSPVRLCEATPEEESPKPFLGLLGLDQFLFKSALSTLNTCILAPGRVLLDRQSSNNVDSIPAGVSKFQLALSMIPSLLVLLLPIINFHDDPLRMLFLALWPWLVSGSIWTTVTQVSHIQSECQFPPEDDTDEPCWWKRQIETTLDYSQDSMFWAVLAAGLNMQGLHHVMPTVCYCHYPRIYPKYRALCESHGVQIRERENIFSAMEGMLSFVDRINGAREKKEAENQVDTSGNSSSAIRSLDVA